MAQLIKRMVLNSLPLEEEVLLLDPDFTNESSMHVIIEAGDKLDCVMWVTSQSISHAHKLDSTRCAPLRILKSVLSLDGMNSKLITNFVVSMENLGYVVTPTVSRALIDMLFKLHEYCSGIDDPSEAYRQH